MRTHTLPVLRRVLRGGLGWGIVLCLFWGGAVHAQTVSGSFSVRFPSELPFRNGRPDLDSVPILAGGNVGSVSATNNLGATNLVLKSSLFGHNVEHLVPDAYLGQPLDPPVITSGATVVWASMTNTHLISPTNAAFFEPSVKTVYAAVGGEVVVHWVLSNGSTADTTYVVEAAPAGRPYRVYWTDSGAPKVNLSGKFVKFHYNSQITAPQYVSTMDTNGIWTSNVVAGLYIDNSGSLNAVGGQQGMIVMQYFKNGLYSEQLSPDSVIVIEVMPIDDQTLDARLGERVLPQGGWAAAEELTPEITAGLLEGDTYLYQHTSADGSHIPKMDWLFPIRRCVDDPWKIQVYWKVSDLMGTKWFYEKDSYAAEWPACHKYVRGDNSVLGANVYFPSNYTASLMAYQEPDDGCATLQDPYTLVTTTNSGRCLVQLSSQDENVWFLPLELITRNDPSFDLRSCDWMISDEIQPFATARSIMFPKGAGGQATLAPSGMSLASNFTLECWVMTGNLDAQSNSTMTVFDKNTQGGSAWSNQVYLGISAGLSGSPGVLTATMGSGRTNQPLLATMTSTNRVYSYEWAHLALTLQGKTLCLYVNGSLGCRTTLGTNGVRQTNSSPLFLGGSAGTNSAPMEGFVDNIRVWDVGLSSTQVLMAMEGNYHGFSMAQLTNLGLKAYFPINASDTLPDLHDLTGRFAGSANDSCYLPDAGAVGMRDSAAYSAYHGYIYQPFGNSFNTSLYHDASSTTPDSTVAIFGVNTNTDLEVWWSQAFQQVGMPLPIYVPNWVQRYHNVWPEPDESPMIVLASGQGSKQGGLYEQGSCVSFPTNGPAGSVTLRKGTYFSGDFTVGTWIYLESLPVAGQILPIFSFGNSDTARVDCVSLTVSSTGTVQFATQNGTITDSIGASLPNATGRWIYVMASLSGSAASLYVDNVLGNQKTGLPVPQSVIRTNCLIGSDEFSNRFHGRVDEFRIWSSVLNEDQRKAAMYNQELLLDAENVTTHFSFDPYKGNLIVDLATGYKALVVDGVLESPGAPAEGSRQYGPLEKASIYFQNNVALPGYNPNEEHAILNNEGGYDVAYAFRDDLNAAFHVSEPFVLVDYTDPETGRPAMDALRVVRTSDVYQVFEDETVAGNPLDGPHPLDLLSGHWTGADIRRSGPSWKARDDEWFAVAAGETPTSSSTVVMGNYYPMQAGFWFPNVASNKQPVVGTPIPWLPQLTSEDYLRNGYWTSGVPTWVTWTITWPEGIPELKVGDTLTEARDDLPDIWNQLSVDVVYQQSTDMSGDPAKKSVLLFDPIRARSVTLTNDLEDFGFATGGADPTIYMRNGRYYFYGLPPDLSERFYFNPNLSSNNLFLIGQIKSPLTGNDYLLMNRLNERQRRILNDLVPATNMQGAWSTAVSLLATDTVGVESNQPFSGIALHAPGNGVGYVALAFNNATNPAMGVGSGVPVQVSLIHVSSNLASGVVIPMEDPYNILSEQMSMLFNLDFAGQPDSFEFEWRWTEPNADGTTPTDPLVCAIYTNGVGVNGLILNGKTVEDLLNRFFAVRYRALSNTVVGVVGTNWSEFTEFSLAEGWVQRILNALTPFEQRMRDLYNNPVETQVSMISAAGRPYEGQVALNQDNLNNVGLIQLYQTVLNRAKAIFDADNMHDAAANQQLLLCASRLNDLYMLLGNEAYADALDPTIGFGSTAIINNSGVLPVDYGSLASSLFCFDNLCANLLEEELALLRGRGNPSLSPGMKTSPIYNRLLWNYTKGITAGEVAYSINYDITGHSNAIIDASTASERFPQGHGDAWGYYLDALGGYYTLLRQTNFDWGVPSISPLLINGLTVDADYFDEKKFAEAGVALARTGVEIIDRTHRQNYDASQEGLFDGYTDANTNRAWGVGQWGARVGVGALCNWAVGNSLLPVSTGWQTNNSSIVLGGEGYIQLPTNAYFDGDFTIEMWIKTYSIGISADVALVSFGDANGNVVRMQLSSGIAPSLDIANSNEWSSMYATNATIATGQWTHVAMVLTGDVARLYVNGALTDQKSGMLSPLPVLRTDNTVGWGLSSPFFGAICEVRVWGDARAANDIAGNMSNRLSGGEAGLVAYWPASEGQGTLLLDRSGNGLPASAKGVVAWTNDMPSMGSADQYDDSGILAINRSTVKALPEITAQLRSAQSAIDNVDRGLNPLGLARDSIPFDIDPLDIDTGGSHFEQILSRAEKALGNADSVFDAVQDANKLLRKQQENANNFQAAAISQEADYTRRLIEIYGYPYSDDIGAGKTYSAGYSGPDLYHYMYVDMSALGWSGTDIEPIYAVTYVFDGVFDDGDDPMKDNPYLNAFGFDTNAVAGTPAKGVTNSITLHNAANGLPCKPTTWTGTRRAEGRMQMAYGDFLKQLLSYRQSLETYKDKTEYLKETFEWYKNTYSPLKNAVYAESMTLQLMKEVDAVWKALADTVRLECRWAKGESHYVSTIATVAIPQTEIVGLAEGGDVFAGIRATTLTINGAAAQAIEAQEILADLASIGGKWLMDTTERVTEMTKLSAEWKLQGIDEETKLGELVRAQGQQLAATKVAYQAMLQSYQNMVAVEQEGQRLLSSRERDRQEMANRIASMRYNDMAFRIFRDDALSRYSSAFDLASRYAYMAAKAYDYETGLLPTESATDPGSRFLGDVVRARTVGRIDNGEPRVGGPVGEPGLADILARMKANWTVLDGRLGFNNPSWRRTAFSLRTELLRIVPGTAGDANWRTALNSYKVDDLFALSEFRRYCIPFAAQGGLRAKEPALVIPFSTTVDFGYNFFGRVLAGGDHFFSSSAFATKIRSIGIWFSNYAANVEFPVGLADSAEAYLVPVGVDVIRSPSDLTGKTLRSWQVMDQAIPVPYEIGSELNDTDWIPLYDSLPDPMSAIRRYNALGAYDDTGVWGDSRINYSSRLIGRSVWNSQWYLIIPAGSLNGDRALALEMFINGKDGDGNGVKDIKLLFETYSYSGN